MRVARALLAKAMSPKAELSPRVIRALPLSGLSEGVLIAARTSRALAIFAQILTTQTKIFGLSLSQARQCPKAE